MNTRPSFEDFQVACWLEAASTPGWKWLLSFSQDDFQRSWFVQLDDELGSEPAVLDVPSASVSLADVPFIMHRLRSAMAEPTLKRRDIFRVHGAMRSFSDDGVSLIVYELNGRMHEGDVVDMDAAWDSARIMLCHPRRGVFEVDLTRATAAMVMSKAGPRAAFEMIRAS